MGRGHAERDAPWPEWHPALWLHALARTAYVPWPVWRSVRAVLAIAGPILVGSLLGDVVVGMWISMGALLIASSERSLSYGARFRHILVAGLVAASAYFLGPLSEAPPPVTVGVMAAVALVAGLVSGYSSVLSGATTLAMLIAALSIGVGASMPYWRSAVLFLAGVAVYALLLALEALLDRRRPERVALVRLLHALADLARCQAESGDDLPAARARALDALEGFDAIVLVHRGTSEGPLPQYDRAAMISRAADQVLARLLADDVQSCATMATRLDECADAVAHHERPNARTTETMVRVAMLEAAIWGKVAKVQHLPLVERARISRPGPELLAAAGRLSLCTALAYVAFYVLPTERPYWIAATVALVMKPDVGSVFARAALRSFGTLGGALIAVALEPVTELPIAGSIVLAGLAACLPWATARSYAWRALVMTPLLMVLLEIAVPASSMRDLSVARLVTTTIGGVIVVTAGYLIWPSARHANVAEPFARALEELARYARDVHARADKATIASDRRTVYRHLSNIQVSLQRMLSDPPPAGREAWAWIPVISAAERVADRITNAAASRTPPDAELAYLIEDLAALVAQDRKEDAAQRSSSPPRHGGDHPEATVRELADELANLEPMLARTGPARS